MIYVIDKGCPSCKQNVAQQTEEDRYAHGLSYASPSRCQCFMPQMTFLCQKFPPFLPSLKAQYLLDILTFQGFTHISLLM